MSLSMQVIGRARVARRWIMALAFLAMALKAAVPVGYMMAAVDGRATLILCPAGIHVHAAPAMAADMPSMAGMDMSAAAHHFAMMEHGAGAAHAAHAAQHAAADCPFALASGAALVAAIEAPTARYYELIPRSEPAAPATIPRAPPPRHEAPRGPPSLA